MRGLPTVLITVSPDASLQAGPPRALYPVGFEIGHVLGGPFEVAVQRAVLRDALELLVKPMEPGNIEEREYPAHQSTATAAE